VYIPGIQRLATTSHMSILTRFWQAARWLLPPVSKGGRYSLWVCSTSLARETIFKCSQTTGGV